MLKRYSLFAGGSAIGATIDYAITLTASDLADLPPTIALGLAMILSASVIFFFHDRITFRARVGVRHGFFLFMLWSGLVFLMRTLLLKMGLYAGLPLAAALLLAIGLASMINFVVSSALIFAKSQP
jgi:putative flippase GtrA